MLSFEENRLNVIERLVQYITDKLPQNEAPLVKNFVRQYYLRVSAEDLTSKSLEDLYGAVVSHWHYIHQRHKAEAKVRAFNPQLTKDGWQSTHTILEIVFDDMPFLVDSVTMVLNKLNLNIHFVIHMGLLKLIRDSEGKILKFYDQKAEQNDQKTEQNDWRSEAAIYIEIDKQSDTDTLASIVQEVKQVLMDVRTVVQDWANMRSKADSILTELEQSRFVVDKTVLHESIEFLHWLVDDHFTFLGYQEYKITDTEEERVYAGVYGSTLGMLKQQPAPKDVRLSDFPIAAQALMLSTEPLIVGKTNIRSTVHRPAFADFVSIKIFDNKGKVVGERRFLGLYTASAYNSSPKQIPFLRRKVNAVLNRAGFLPKSHDERALLNILETLPRDDLFQANEIELLDLSTRILHLQERQKIRLFMRVDAYALFISCFVFLPKEKFTATLGEKMKEILLQGLKGIEVGLATRFSESASARLHFLVRIDPEAKQDFDVSALEQKLIKAGRTWQDNFRDALIDTCEEERASDLLNRYRHAFSASYRESFSATNAVLDIDYFEALSKDNPLAMSLYVTFRQACVT